MTGNPATSASHDARSTWLVRLLVLLAVGLAANSILGPLALDVIEYRYTESLVNQGIGLDLVALVAAAPIAIAAAMLVVRHHPAGSVLAFIPATFAAYMAPQYVIGPDYLGLPGNNERFVVLHLALFVLGVTTTIVAWRTIDRTELQPRTIESDGRRSLALFGMVAFILFGRWLTGLIDLVAGDPTGADYRENPTAYLLIGFLDLGIVVPAASATAIGLRRQSAWARTASYAVIGWFALVPAAVAAMAVVMQIEDDPNASTGTTGVFVLAAMVFTVGAASLYRPMLHTRPTDGPSPDSAEVADGTQSLDQPRQHGATR
jgi:hypothetical protein